LLLVVLAHASDFGQPRPFVCEQNIGGSWNGESDATDILGTSATLRRAYREAGCGADSGFGDLGDRNDIDGGYIDCGYTSLAQCAQSASGRAAQCITNPHFASPRYQQRRRVSFERLSAPFSRRQISG
jgi:hypothetical protein